MRLQCPRERAGGEGCRTPEVIWPRGGQERRGYRPCSQLLHHGATILVAWHHGEIHSLVRHLADDEWKRAALGYRSDGWPHACGDEAWSAHKLPGSKCYDLIWRMTLTRQRGVKSSKWEVSALTTTLEGFNGEPEAPCLEGLTPTSWLTRSSWLERFSTWSS